MSRRVLLIAFVSVFSAWSAYAQLVVPIQNYAVDVNGQVRLTVNSATNKYYMLQVRHNSDSVFSHTTSMTLGQPGTTILTEPLSAYPIDHYQVLEYSISSPFDTDADGTNDYAEFGLMPFAGPLNAAASIAGEHGLVTLNSLSTFKVVSTEDNSTPWIEYLNGVEYVKFIILDFYSSHPKVYFINSDNYSLHLHFANYLGVDHLAPSVKKGQIIYNPMILSNNGTLGAYAFNFSNNEVQNFEVVQQTHELLAANMPFLTNNLAYFITENIEDDYQDNLSLYQNSRVPVLFETDVYAGINYWGLNQTEGYGFFRLLAPGDIPDTKDIVLCEAIPNSLPRVGGIISSFMQTPLSHVNLRAIHDNVPNAFIRDPLTIDTIANLLNHYIYFKAGQSNYEIREATLDEVNAWYEKMRPASEQIPPLNLSYKLIIPLSEIGFSMYDGFGAKVANVATMRTFGFPDGTIPNGFGIPFYFYREFMEYNGFFEQIKLLLIDPTFISDRDYRAAKLEEFREAIESASMPDWMLSQLSAMQNSFPSGMSIRCRSSTNNEDLPGFSGAGLYDSKTHKPSEGHISKTIKQVYASLWNLRAFEAREFYRVNHFYTSMGILVHPNFNNEQVNGVGVSADPLYNTTGMFYLNSQLGEALITNPESTYPEELLIKRDPSDGLPYSVIQYSSLLDVDSLLMTDLELDLLRQYLATIHDQFEILYNAVGNTTFVMDIEYKIDHNNQLVIKQARPWVSYVPTPPAPPISEECVFLLFPNPTAEVINVGCENCGIITVRITDIKGSFALEKIIDLSINPTAQIDISYLPSGTYVVSGIRENSVCKSAKFIRL